MSGERRQLGRCEEYITKGYHEKYCVRPASVASFDIKLIAKAFALAPLKPAWETCGLVPGIKLTTLGRMTKASTGTMQTAMSMS
jgi:hypothetical protein